ncbi:MAG: rhodanese-like domain-containing protein [Methylococcales bacterium]|jgi:glyoxylase-like metal-dependent hydrolase (beta-lactamase superfamily II)/rhodanese-related sulfurtransferase|nr:MBL fold metallo-hydrolase [Methylococcaceae bacterium]
MFFKQFFDEDTWTFTYFLADELSQEAVIIDPVKGQIEHYLNLINDMGVTLKYALETHVHADHITAGGLLRNNLGTLTGVGAACGAECADIQINPGDVLTFGGNEQIRVIGTPGHTPGSVSFYWRDRIFTGDSLLIGGCGRVDFQGGDAGALYDGITTQLFTLPDQTLVYPGHDYQGNEVSSMGQERRHNSRLAGKSRAQFIALMNNLNLPHPKYIDQAVPANKVCGLDESERQDAKVKAISTGNSAQTMVLEARQQICEISVGQAEIEMQQRDDLVIIDVREENEFVLGHINQAIHIPRGILEFKLQNINKLADKMTPVLLYCGSGARSALASVALQQLGYGKVMSLAGGYKAWSLK